MTRGHARQYRTYFGVTDQTWLHIADTPTNDNQYTAFGVLEHIPTLDPAYFKLVSAEPFWPVEASHFGRCQPSRFARALYLPLAMASSLLSPHSQLRCRPALMMWRIGINQEPTVTCGSPPRPVSSRNKQAVTSRTRAARGCLKPRTVSLVVQDWKPEPFRDAETNHAVAFHISKYAGSGSGVNTVNLAKEIFQVLKH